MLQLRLSNLRWYEEPQVLGYFVHAWERYGTHEGYVKPLLDALRSHFPTARETVHYTVYSSSKA
jgi:hypothetical protein